ncbi:MAG: hypothetical protein IPG17_03235 [Sandaracinaceae bacterium]|nr:hypothetical protein [Sandaracinaceae bacterium]MBK7155819.1 hypothetical protein [Sandaracinaceae bacterium]
MTRVLSVFLIVLGLVPGCGSGPVDMTPDSAVAIDGGGGMDDQGGGMDDQGTGLDAETPDDMGADAGTPDDVGVDAGPETDQGFDAGLAPLGASCSDGGECDSGFCADGVCCDGACDGGCERCSVSGACFIEGGGSGVVECRASAGVCDVAEFCNGTDPECPLDEFAAGGTMCLPFACSGAGPACPTSCSSQAECGSGTTCVGGSCIDARVVFVSSVATNGNLGGIAGADAFCQGLADNAGLGRTFRAWISLTTNAASSRITPATVPYVMLVAGQPGVVVADDWTDLTDGTLDAAIVRTETGDLVTQDFAWTNTLAAGNAPHDVATCEGWTASDSGEIGIVGMTTGVDSTWSFALNRACDSQYSVYCVEE